MAGEDLEGGRREIEGLGQHGEHGAVGLSLLRGRGDADLGRCRVVVELDEERLQQLPRRLGCEGALASPWW